MFWLIEDMLNRKKFSRGKLVTLLLASKWFPVEFHQQNQSNDYIRKAKTYIEHIKKTRREKNEDGRIEWISIKITSSSISLLTSNVPCFNTIFFIKLMHGIKSYRCLQYIGNCGFSAHKYSHSLLPKICCFFFVFLRFVRLCVESIDIETVSWSCKAEAASSLLKMTNPVKFLRWVSFR